MNKAKLIDLISDKCSLSKTSARWVLDSLLKSVAEALSNQDQVRIAGLGSFKVVNRGERQGRNPKTGQIVTYSAKKYVKFTASKSLQDLLN